VPRARLIRFHREPRLTGPVNAPEVMERNMVNDNIAADLDRLWELMKKISFPMLVTRDGERLRARPMSANLAREENAVYFLTDARWHKDEEIARDPHVNLSFADAANQKYASLTGTAFVSNDRAKIKQLFSTPARAWWNSAEDPNIRVLKIALHDAELWDSPGKLMSYVRLAVAVVSSTRPDMGHSDRKLLL